MNSALLNIIIDLVLHPSNPFIAWALALFGTGLCLGIGAVVYYDILKWGE